MSRLPEGAFWEELGEKFPNVSISSVSLVNMNWRYGGMSDKVFDMVCILLTDPKDFYCDLWESHSLNGLDLLTYFDRYQKSLYLYQEGSLKIQNHPNFLYVETKVKDYLKTLASLHGWDWIRIYSDNKPIEGGTNTGVSYQ